MHSLPDIISINEHYKQEHLKEERANAFLRLKAAYQSYAEVALVLAEVAYEPGSPQLSEAIDDERSALDQLLTTLDKEVGNAKD